MKLSKGKLKVPYTMCGKRGDTIWQRNRYGQIGYPYHVPTNPNSVAQRLVRANWRSVAQRWRLLTELQRQVWCREARYQRSRRRLGQSFPLKGYHYYMRVNMLLANRGLPQMDLPPLDSLEAQRSLPLLTQRLLLPLGEALISCSAAPASLPERAPPPGA